MNKKSISLAIVVIIAFLAFVSCESDGDGSGDGYTVVFDFINIADLDGAGAHDGETIYAKLTTSDCMAEAVVWGSAVISGDAASMTLEDIPEGTYIGCGFIDVNGNASGGGDSIPDTGDYAGDSGDTNISITEDDNVNIDVSGWSVIPPG
ncbi:MAG: hypothetical protein JW881_04960 [Spirochaetales bacterium]|nr:hypothetical protein [Spirochaetales bacterium]